MLQTRGDSDLIRELCSEMRDVKKLVLDLCLMQGNVPDNVKGQKRLNLQGLRDRYGTMETMGAKLDALVVEMENEYTAGVDYVPSSDGRRSASVGEAPPQDLWVEKYSEAHRQKYWVNTATRESTWARPAKPEPQRGEMSNPLHAPGQSAWVQKGDEEQAEV